ncbi:MAG: hypothetical protein KKD48_04855 [Nanoarchaeota archaeon]|nr:hypothetical protein [Nanoarchaeota archaeon]
MWNNIRTKLKYFLLATAISLSPCSIDEGRIWNYLTQEYSYNLTKKQQKSPSNRQQVLSEIEKIIGKEFKNEVDLSKYFEEQNKMFIIARLDDKDDYQVISGQILYNEQVRYPENNNLSYEIIEFIPNNTNSDSFLSFWYNNRIYLNLKKAREHLKKIDILDVPSYKLENAKKINNLLKKRSKKNNTSKEEEGIKMIKNCVIIHELSHTFGADEKEAVDTELKYCDKDWVVYITPFNYLAK